MIVNSLGRAVTGSPVLDGQTRHDDAICTGHLGDDSVRRSASCEGSDKGDGLGEMHFDDERDEIYSKGL